jgi:hypothetical protein
MAKKQIKKNEDTLLIALACGATVEAASAQCGITTRTAYRRMQDPEFKNRLTRTRSEMIERATGMLTAAAGEAVRTLLSLQKAAVPPAVRMSAARAILEIGMKLREVVDIEERLRRLEALVPQHDGTATRRLSA